MAKLNKGSLELETHQVVEVLDGPAENLAAQILFENNFEERLQKMDCVEGGLRCEKRGACLLSSVALTSSIRADLKMKQKAAFLIQVEDHITCIHGFVLQDIND